jgi:hypothetical protein
METRNPKYNSLLEWRKAEPKAYASAYNKGYIEEICLKFGWVIPSKELTNMPNGYWNIKENVLAEAKKYKTTSEWKKKSRGSYKSAKRNGWLEEASAHMVKKELLTKELCIESAKNFKSMSEWKNSENYMYRVAMNNGWLDEIRLFLGFRVINPKKFWTKERCIEEAKNYNNKGQWRKNSPSSYGKALVNKWLGECCAHMSKLQTQRPAKTWKDKNTCLESAKAFNNPSAWSKAFPGAYSSAIKNGWFKEATAHMDRRKTLPNGYWNNKENVIAEARKYTTRKDWVKNSGGSYESAKRNGWLEEAIAHMIKNKVATKYKWDEEIFQLIDKNNWGAMKDVRAFCAYTQSKEFLTLFDDFKKTYVDTPYFQGIKN